MKFQISFLYLCFILSINHYTLSAQDDSDSRYSIQFDFGIANGFHYHSPVTLMACIEGCQPIKQEPRLAPAFEISIYRSITPGSAIKFGLGYNSIRLWEKGTSIVYPEPYTVTYEFNFVNFSFGHRMTIGKSNKIRPYIENNMMLDFLTQYEYLLNRVNIAYKLDLGLLINLTNKLGLNVNGFYKTAIHRYNHKDNEINYVPFAYGLEMGLGLKMK